ncbi:MAG TPA: hypothetical protein VN442_01885 [Bryobacteraceae bacterium]|nr:hypothetical protein [Bryobacteraceae bacterium]
MTQSEEVTDFAVQCASFEELSSPASEALAILVLHALGSAIGAAAEYACRSGAVQPL